MVFVETEGLSKRFGDFDALVNCTLRVEPGEVFGLLGPNGAGKTTLLRLLLGFLRPTGGSGRVGGVDILHDSVGVRRQVAYLPGDAHLPRHMKSHHLLRLFAELQPYGDYQRSLEIATRLELDLRRRVAFMSTGMRQKLALATVLGPRTPLLILDEPTANLDPSVRGEVLKLVQEAKGEGRTVIFSSHVLSEIEEVCDRAVFLRRGHLVLSQPLADLRARHLLRGMSRSRLHAPPFSPAATVQIQQRDDGRFVIDACGALEEVLAWLLQQGEITALQIEPVRLRTVYNAVHFGDREALAAAAFRSTEGAEGLE